MKPFRFNLENVLEIRRTQEMTARRELATALDEQRRALNHYVESTQTMNCFLDQITALNSEQFSVANRERQLALQQVQEKRCEELRGALDECERHATVKRAAVIDAHRHCQLLERLKMSRQCAAMIEANRNEQHLLDDLAMTGATRANRRDTGLC